MSTGRDRAFAAADDDDPPLGPPLTRAPPPFSQPIRIPRSRSQAQPQHRDRQSSGSGDDEAAAAEDSLRSPLHDDEDDLEHAPSTYSVSLPHQSSPSLSLPLSTVPIIRLQPEGGDSPDSPAAADAVSASDSSTHAEHVGETVASFRLLSVLGRGGYGVVYLVLHLSSQRVYAMKVMKKSLVLSKKVEDSARHEKEILSLIHHPFLVTLRYAFQSASKLYLVMDFVQGGELWRRLDALPGRSMSERDCRFYAAEIVVAFEYLHARDIIYRDLKPENILLDRRGHVVLSDFGFAKSCVTGERSSNSFLGTAHAMSPEMVDGSGHGKGADWWALGVLICELLTGRPPFTANNRQQLQQQILHGPLHLPSHLTLHAKHIISQLLKRQLDRRLGCGEGGVQAVKAHPFFAGINWQKLAERKVQPPWLPPLRGERDISMFDPDFTSERLCDSPSSLRRREGSISGREGGGGRGRAGGKGGSADSEDEEKERVRGFEGFSYTRSPRVAAMAERSQEIGVTVGSSSNFVLSSPSTTPSHHSPLVSVLSLGDRAEGGRGEGEGGGQLGKKLEAQRAKERLRELEDEQEEKERQAARERQKEKEERKLQKKKEQEERMRAEKEEADRQRTAAERRFQQRQQEEQAAIRQTQREEEERKRQSAAAAAAAQPPAVSHLSQQLAAQRLPAPLVSASGVKLAPWARLASPAAAAAVSTPSASAAPAPSAALPPQIPITLRLFPSLDSASSASPSSKTAATAAPQPSANVAVSKPSGKGKTSWARLF